MDALGDYDSDEEEIEEGEFYYVNVDHVDDRVEDVPEREHRNGGTSRNATEEDRVHAPGEAKLNAARGMVHPKTDDQLRSTWGLGMRAVYYDRDDHVAGETHVAATSTRHPDAYSQPAAGGRYPSKGEDFPATVAHPDTDDQFPPVDAYPDTDNQFPGTEAYPATDGQYPATDTRPGIYDQFPATGANPDTDDQFSATSAYPNTDMQFALTQNTVAFRPDSDSQLAAKSALTRHLGTQHKAVRPPLDKEDEIAETAAYPETNEQYAGKHTATTNTCSAHAGKEMAAQQKVATGAYRDTREKFGPTQLSAAEVSDVYHPPAAQWVAGMQPSAHGAIVTDTSVKTAEPIAATHLAADGATGIYPDTDDQFAVTHWREYLDIESKCTYFYNEAAGVSTWDEPAAYIPVEEPPVVPVGWIATLDPDSGCYYYYHIASQISYWDQPGDVYSNLEPDVADRLRSLRGESTVSQKQPPQIDFMDVSAPRYSGAMACGQVRHGQQGRVLRVSATEAARRALARAAAPSGAA